MAAAAFALQDVLRCPQCRGPLRTVPDTAPPALACTCGLRVPIRDGIPRFVQEHLIEGRPVAGWVFAENPMSSS